MPSISNCLLKDIQQTHNKIINSNKPPNISNLHSILAAIQFVTTSQSSDHDNMIRMQIKQLLVDMLKCMDSWKQCREGVGEAKECVEMYEILVDNIARLGTNQVLPKLPQLCIKIISPILPASKPSTILKLTQMKIPVITSLPLNLSLLQHLHKTSHSCKQQILVEFTRQLLSQDRAVAEIQTIFKLLIDIVDGGSLHLYIVVRVLSALIHDYVKGFQASYSRSAKYVGGRYQPRLITVLIKALYKIKARFSIRQVTDEVIVRQTVKNQEAGSQDENKPCNICGDARICQQTYLIGIEQSYYKIQICIECVKKMTTKQSQHNPKLKQLQIIFYLIFNSEQPSNVPYFQQICTMLYPYLYVKSSTVVHSPSNSQLKLVRHALVTALFERVAVGHTWDRLWAILMIVTNHEDAPTRLKAVKYLYEILQSCRYATQHVSKSTNQNILKCIKNRTIDTIPQIRIQSVFCFLTILQNDDNKQITKLNEDLGFALSLIRQQFIFPICSQLIKNKQTLNQNKICEMLEKLFLVSTSLINLQENNVNDDIYLDSRNVVGLFACFSGLIVAARRLGKQSKEKKSRKTKKQEETKQIMKKYRSILKKLFIVFKNRKSLMQTIIQYDFNEYPPDSRQQCYNSMINILIDYCGLTEDNTQFYNNLITGFQQCDHENQEQNSVEKLIGDGDRSERDGLWMENEMLLSWIVKYQGGINIEKVVSQMLKICQDENNMISNGLISLAKQLKILLEYSQKAVRKQSIVQKLSNIRTLLLTDLLAESNTISIGCLINPVQTTQQDSNLRCLCSLLISIQSYLAQAFKSTLAMYQRLYLLLTQLTEGCFHQHRGLNQTSFPENHFSQKGISNVNICNEQVTDQQKMIEKSDDVVRLAILTIKMMLAILPHLSTAIDKANSMNGQKQVIKMGWHLQQIFQNLTLLIKNQLKTKTRQDSLLLQSSHQLSILIRMNSQFFFESQQVLSNLFTVNLPVPHSLVHFNRLVFSINWILSIAKSVTQMEKIRDTFMIFVNQIFDSNDESRAIMLHCRAFYLVICQIYKKGLGHLMALGKFMLFGLAIDADQTNMIITKEREAIRQICMKNVQQINNDNNQARQLYNSLTQTLKLYNSHYKLKQNHNLYISNPSPQPPQKHTHLQQSLLKSLCNHLQRLAISNRLQSFNPQVYCQVMLISNTINRCKFMAIDDVKTILPTFMAVADSIYFQVLNQVRSSQDSRVGITLWAVLGVLAGILKGNQYKSVLNNLDKFFKFKDGVAQISIEPVKLDYCGVKSIQQLYEAIIQGRHSKLEQDYSDQQSTYDTQNKMRSNLSLPSTKPKKQKWRGQSKQKVSEQVKNTKRAIGVNKNKSNRSAPKSGLLTEDFVVKDKKAKDEDVEQYKTKLRVRKKMVV